MLQPGGLIRLLEMRQGAVGWTCIRFVAKIDNRRPEINGEQWADVIASDGSALLQVCDGLSVQLH